MLQSSKTHAQSVHSHHIFAHDSSAIAWVSSSVCPSRTLNLGAVSATCVPSSIFSSSSICSLISSGTVNSISQSVHLGS
ncbi:hypothetical protein IKO18_00570 [bacterium]|nr:hypothetical protein [bacterium]